MVIVMLIKVAVNIDGMETYGWQRPGFQDNVVKRENRKRLVSWNFILRVYFYWHGTLWNDLLLDPKLRQMAGAMYV